MKSTHLSPVKSYTAVFAALLGLTLTTTAVSLIDLGSLNVVVALTIAIGKALLVLLYFMHVRYSSWLTWVFAGAGFFWFAILITLITSDVLTRN